MKYFAVRFYKKTGKIDKTLEHEIGPAMLKMWGLTNTNTKSKDTIIFDSEGNVLAYYEGTGSYPKIHHTEGEKIAEYCPGLLEACLETTNADNQ